MFGLFEISRCIHFNRLFIDFCDVNWIAVLERPKLLEAFNSLQRCWPQTGKFQQEITPVNI